MSSFHRVAAIQMTSGMDVTNNLAQAEQLLLQAAKQGAVLAVLPEMFPLLGKGPAFKAARIQLQETDGSGPIQDFLSRTAKQLGIWIIAGTMPLKSADPTRAYAACLVYDANGDRVARYDKLHLFDAKLSDSEAYHESDTTVPGNKIVLVQTPVGKVGLSVCYDMRFPELYRELLSLGAEIFAVPVAFAVTTGKMHWDVLTRAIAIQNFSYFIGAGQYGRHVGRETYGNSVIIAPNGEVLSRLEQGAGVVIATINLAELANLRAQLPALKHQRIAAEKNSLDIVIA